MVLKWLGRSMLLLFAAVILVPLLIVLFTSLKTTPQFYANPLGLPESLSFHNFKALFDRSPCCNSAANILRTTPCCLPESW
ncbi:hypothetical protein [Paenibacillus sp. LHD-38]|uniref:hypothetical protein n=1 Tax=Paenibacillus sp. LHD-38 TaxID=3072143 RepID=UPI00280E07FC|nr:hypothetical protein [Paenibacillus sp. LHD-38]MDQ8733807.1 hypothetical protein [Paenibacillus sp. LHD-38]